MTPGWHAELPGPALARGEAHVWRALLDAPGWPSSEGLPADERERAARKLRERARWTAAHWALRFVLAGYLRVEPAAVALATRPDGKPELASGPGAAALPLRFNLSHSDGLALVAVCREREVGVDVERLRARRDALALADRALDPVAAAEVRAAPEDDRAAVFHAAWTRHEARAKCTGEGITGAAPDPAALWTCELSPGEGYAAALALAGPAPARVRTWSLAAPGIT